MTVPALEVFPTLHAQRPFMMWLGSVRVQHAGQRAPVSAATVDEFGTDLAGLGRFQWQCESLLGIAVVRGNGVVSDEEPVPAGHSVLGQRARQCRDGCCVRFGLSGFLGLGGVHGEEHAGAGVVGEVVCQCACAPESALVCGEVNSECCADAVWRPR
jgi:hypothetical protein